jgi:hypothetical protein
VRRKERRLVQLEAEKQRLQFEAAMAFNALAQVGRREDRRVERRVSFAVPNTAPAAQNGADHGVTSAALEMESGLEMEARRGVAGGGGAASGAGVGLGVGLMSAGAPAAADILPHGGPRPFCISFSFGSEPSSVSEISTVSSPPSINSGGLCDQSTGIQLLRPRPVPGVRLVRLDRHSGADGADGADGGSADGSSSSGGFESGLGTNHREKASPDNGVGESGASGASGSAAATAATAATANAGARGRGVRWGQGAFHLLLASLGGARSWSPPSPLSPSTAAPVQEQLELAASVGVAKETRALTALYEATGGALWTSMGLSNRDWLVGEPCTGRETSWAGVHCERGGHCGVYGLSLHANGLRGTLPTQIGWLTSLRGYLGLVKNALSGTMPTEFGRLSNLNRIYLNGNRLSGTVNACTPAEPSRRPTRGSFPLATRGGRVADEISTHERLARARRAASTPTADRWLGRLM